MELDRDDYISPLNILSYKKVVKSVYILTPPEDEIQIGNSFINEETADTVIKVVKDLLYFLTIDEKPIEENEIMVVVSHEGLPFIKTHYSF